MLVMLAFILPLGVFLPHEPLDIYLSATFVGGSATGELWHMCFLKKRRRRHLNLPAESEDDVILA